MTDITLEQRAATVPPTTAVTFVPAFSEASRMLGMSAANGNHDGVVYWQGIVEQFEAAAKEALRLSAGADVSRLLAAWYEQGIRQGMRVQSPGHAHERPGIWDDDNGKLAGVECAACALWKIAAQIAAAPRHETGEGL